MEAVFREDVVGCAEDLVSSRFESGLPGNASEGMLRGTDQQ